MGNKPGIMGLSTSPSVHASALALRFPLSSCSCFERSSDFLGDGIMIRFSGLNRNSFHSLCLNTWSLASGAVSGSL